MTFRSEVLAANPGMEATIQNEIEKCGANCGYSIRVGSKVVALGQQYNQAVAEADKAVKISKENGNVPVRIAEDGGIIIQTEAPLNKYSKIVPTITQDQAVKTEDLVRETKKKLSEAC